MKIENDGYTTLFRRLRESGQAAVAIAAWIPSFLQKDDNQEDLQKVAASISTCRADCEEMVREAEASGDPRLAGTAQKVLGLWGMLGEKIAARAPDQTLGVAKEIDRQGLHHINANEEQ